MLREGTVQLATQNPIHEKAHTQISKRNSSSAQRESQQIFDTQARLPKPARGRPAKYYELTAYGWQYLGQDYADIANEALKSIQNLLGGDDVVESLASKRFSKIIAPAQDSINNSDYSLIEKAELLCISLNHHSYAADTKISDEGVDLCRHHCPVYDVAVNFPNFCRVEDQIFSDYFGQSVQRVSTIAQGKPVCRTFIPFNADRLRQSS